MFNSLETSPLPVKGCRLRTMLDTISFHTRAPPMQKAWDIRVKVIHEELRYSYWLSVAWWWNWQYVFNDFCFLRLVFKYTECLILGEHSNLKQHRCHVLSVRHNLMIEFKFIYTFYTSASTKYSSVHISSVT